MVERCVVAADIRVQFPILVPFLSLMKTQPCYFEGRKVGKLL